jgi:hypothetical protein
VVTAPDIPGHRVGGVLGSGGFATVYRCWQVAVGREVAVKVDNRVLLTERDRRRFLREVTAAGRLSGHPHVIDVYDAGTLEDGRPYLVMELCPGGSLNDALRRHGPMPAGPVRDIGIRLADALAAAHASGVLHRDIKPANILVNRFGMVGLSDFGLASIISAHGEQTASREALTPAYSSPETFRGEEPTVLADIYSLAATLYALLAGRPPRFPPDGRPPSFATLMSLHDKPVEDVPGVPPELMALLRAGLSPDPAARPPSAVALRDALADPRRYLAATGPSGPAIHLPTGPTGPPGPGGLRQAGAGAGAAREPGRSARRLGLAAAARCPASPECFNGLTIISGSASAKPLPCNGPHVWETFAIAILPADVRTFDQPMVAANPAVRRVCSQAVMLASRQGAARRLPAQAWDIDVLPPSEAAFASGSHVYRCLAHEIGPEPRTSQFRR